MGGAWEICKPPTGLFQALLHAVMLISSFYSGCQGSFSKWGIVKVIY